MNDQRYARHEAFFGKAGQAKIAAASYCIIGLGGTGSHVAQQIAYLGGVEFSLVDRDAADETSLNRLVTAGPGDEGKLKVDLAGELILRIQPSARIQRIPRSCISAEGFAAIRRADVVFGCVDRDGARLILNEVCQAYEIPYMDVATDIDSGAPRTFGGRVHFSAGGERCVYCDGLLDDEAIRNDLESDVARNDHDRIYGVPREELGGTGPSVVSLNGLLASSAVTEFMIDLTGLRPAVRWLEYRGAYGILARKTDDPKTHCPYCKGTAIRGKGDEADLDRYIRQGLGERL